MDLEKRRTELLERREAQIVTLSQIDGAIAILNEQLNPPEEGNDETETGVRQEGAAESG